MKDFQQIYKFPFTLKFPDIGWVYDADDNFVFQFEIYDVKLMEEFLWLINNEKVTAVPKVKFVFENGYIKTEDGQNIILIRGWGNLTSIKGLLPEEAASVQDSLGKYILKKLNR